ncbi:glycosyltransferase involved in cell wall biosynthesis [Sphingomonas jejuensis]|uniref:Glycosyltransferase involved in cell wall biosynthesis n=1 Tax=Sphingomonas jejuensis TaxID=904715 RepID=A0ABX0XMT3_9SPHN|nr:glycosyltransferase family 4 protein [Sphingomonas jejuensis]NJC34010.1 glycosyltransferase involved in cell wall biosynthesis [Sphingomonas jejuensis]
MSLARPVLRVVMTADAVGGVWSYALDLAAGLRAHGTEVLIAVAGPAPCTDQQSAAEQAGIALVTLPGPLDWLDATPATLERQAAALERIARGWKADLIQLNSPILAAFGTFDRPVLGICHSDLATWWSAVRGDTPPADFRWRIDLTARGYRACDMLVAPTHAFAAATGDAYGIRPQVVLNGRTARRSLSVARRPGSILAAGRLWDAGKGMAVLDAAAASMSAPVAAAGPVKGPGGDGVVLSHVQALGRLAGDDLAARMAETDIFVSPALYEPFGLAVLESAQCGAALVLSGIEGHRELWMDAALFVPPGDAAALAEALDALAADPAEARALGQRAQARAARYSADRMSAGMDAIQRRMLSAAAPRLAVGA